MREYSTKHQIIQKKTVKKLGKRKVNIDFNGGDISSDGGLFMISEIDRKINLTAPIAEILDKHDPRYEPMVTHSNLRMLRQRINGIVSGYEDITDHDHLRHDLNHQVAAETDEALASSPTLCRMENNQGGNRKVCLRMMEQIVENFIGSFTDVPEELILDFDATDDPVHGEQLGRYFHGYYDRYCFLPLYVFCGERLLVSYLRPSSRHASTHAWTILKMLVKRFRREWPEVRIVLRGDSDFSPWKMLSWCDDHGVGYIAGISPNSRLKKITSRTIGKAEKQYNRTGEKAKLYNEVYYQADTWDRKRHAIVKAEHTEKGPNTRYVLTNLKGRPRHLYEKVYCARGNMENRIKEQQLYLFADRTSCHAWWANQFRLLLSSLAYILVEKLRRSYLKGTRFAHAQAVTIREKLIKVGAVIVQNTRTIYLHLSSTYPYKAIFSKVVDLLVPG
jgi:hypothetical protein